MMATMILHINWRPCTKEPNSLPYSFKGERERERKGAREGEKRKEDEEAKKQPRQNDIICIFMV